MSSDPLKPQFFVTRQNGNMVPLIAMDELPSTVSIRNVARSLSSYDVSGMTGVGTYEARHLHHVVEPPAVGQNIDRSENCLERGQMAVKTDNNTAGNGSRSLYDGRGFSGSNSMVQNDRSLMASKYAPAARSEQEASQRANELIASKSNNVFAYPGAPPKAYGIHEQPPAVSRHHTPAPRRQPHAVPPPPFLGPFANSQIIPALPFVAAGPCTTSPSIPQHTSQSSAPSPLPAWHATHAHLQPAPGVKEYCSYWLRHGECDYAQQGCLYKHEMPLDKATLERLGHRDIPRWYREKHGLASMLAACGAPGCLDVGERRRKEEIMSKSTWRQGRAGGEKWSVARGKAGPSLGMELVQNLKRMEIDEIDGPWDQASLCSSARCLVDAAGAGNSPKPLSTETKLNNNGNPANGNEHSNAKSSSTRPALQMLTEKDKQLRKTIAELDAWEARERVRKATLKARVETAEAVEVAQNTATAAAATTNGDLSGDVTGTRTVNGTGSPLTSRSAVFDKDNASSDQTTTPVLTPGTSAESSDNDDLDVEDGSATVMAPALAPTGGSKCAIAHAHSGQLKKFNIVAKGVSKRKNAGGNAAGNDFANVTNSEGKTKVAGNGKGRAAATPPSPSPSPSPAAAQVSKSKKYPKKKDSRVSFIIAAKGRADTNAHHRRRLAPPSDSGSVSIATRLGRAESLNGLAMEKEADREVAREMKKFRSSVERGEVDLLEAYDHSD